MKICLDAGHYGNYNQGVNKNYYEAKRRVQKNSSFLNKRRKRKGRSFNMKICLDAGHYGNYNQGVNKNYYEAKVVWDITNLQKKYLEEYEGVSVVLTRDNQAKDLALYDRGAKAKGFDLLMQDIMVTTIKG